MPKPTPSAPVSTPGGTNAPVHTVRHRNIKATVWRNPTEKGPMYNVTVARSYKTDGDQWHDSHSFGYDDLMNLAKVLYDTHSYISALRAKEFEREKPRRAERGAS